MSGLTLAALLRFDPTPCTDAARAWLMLGGEIDDAAERLFRAGRDLEDAWPQGPASQAAHTSAGRMAAEVSNAFQPARRIGLALEDLASALTDLRIAAQALVDDAARDGLTVDAVTGVVGIPADTSGRWSDVGAAQRSVDAYTGELAAVLARAREADDRTAGVMTANVPDPVSGFGVLSLDAVGAEDLAAQRGRDPGDVNEWWNCLTPRQQDDAIRRHPALVGNLDGVPSADRDTANRISLAQQQENLQMREDALRARLAYLAANPYGTDVSTGDEVARLKAEVAGIDRRQAGLASVDRALARLGAAGLLIGLDPAGDGRAIVSAGNPDTTRHTAVFVPGLGTEIEDAPSNAGRVLRLQETADRLTTESRDVAAVMWLGYDAPEVDSVAFSERSRQGGELLDAYINSLHATHSDPGGGVGGDYHVTAVGHSYGSTVVAEAALRGDGLAVDDIVVAGSPGMHTAHASDLGVRPGHVWAGSGGGDVVSDLNGHPAAVGARSGLPGNPVAAAVDVVVAAVESGHGGSPHRPEFGANRYTVDTYGHSDYWNNDTESLTNQARVVVGQYERVTLDHGQAPPGPDQDGEPD